MKDGQTVPAGRKVCIVRGCHVHEDEEDFIGDLCAPCHEFVATGRGIHSQAYRNARELAPRKMTFDLEPLTVEDVVAREELTCLFCRLTGCDHAFTFYGKGFEIQGIHARCLDGHEARSAPLFDRIGNSLPRGIREERRSRLAIEIAKVSLPRYTLVRL